MHTYIYIACVWHRRADPSYCRRETPQRFPQVAYFSFYCTILKVLNSKIIDRDNYMLLYTFLCACVAVCVWTVNSRNLRVVFIRTRMKRFSFSLSFSIAAQNVIPKFVIQAPSVLKSNKILREIKWCFKQSTTYYEIYREIWTWGRWGRRTHWKRWNFAGPDRTACDSNSHIWEALAGVFMHAQYYRSIIGQIEALQDPTCTVKFQLTVHVNPPAVGPSLKLIVL
jgi:hypothetical protein